MTVGGQKGRYFCGDYTYLDNAPQVFFPAAGSRHYSDGGAYSQGDSGRYWSSSPYGDHAGYLSFNSSDVTMNDVRRPYGYSVRCVQVTD
jgi:uncharacterized protein (TIGR02145 family)